MLDLNASKEVRYVRVERLGRVEISAPLDLADLMAWRLDLEQPLHQCIKFHCFNNDSR